MLDRFGYSCMLYLTKHDCSQRSKMQLFYGLFARAGATEEWRLMSSYGRLGHLKHWRSNGPAIPNLSEACGLFTLFLERAWVGDPNRENSDSDRPTQARQEMADNQSYVR